MMRNLGKVKDYAASRSKTISFSYYPDETKSTVYAVRVIYGGRDISRQLSETETI